MALLFNCKASKISNHITKSLNTDFYNNQFTGLIVYDPVIDDTLININADNYFTPASNTKIITLYTALKLLPENIPAFKYTVEGDTLFILGTGDPTFLHPYFKDSTALKMAMDFKKVKIAIDNIKDEKFGPGWAWEDYDTYFSPERSSFPMYGNTVTVSNGDSLLCTPVFMKDRVSADVNQKFSRAYNQNKFYYNSKNSDTLTIPMVMDSLLIFDLWNHLLPDKVKIGAFAPKSLQVKEGIVADSLYKRMMLESDNFLAEQILILVSSTMSDTLSSNKVRKWVIGGLLKDLKQPPRWVDGSGLSRYNLFTPMSFVQILKKLYDDIPHDRLFNLFPVGGESGTLRRNYKGATNPYIHAKSGSLENNYSLSGYLLTNSGKILIFSFMNNHYTNPTIEIKKRMESVFEYLRDNY